MRYPWLTALLLGVVAVIAAVVIWRSWRSPQNEFSWVANTQMIEDLPAFRSSRLRNRIGVSLAGSALIIAMVASAVLAGGPVNRDTKNPTLGQRDMVLCLDASGSMLPYDGQILRTVSELVDGFTGERMALEMWSARSVVKFPLTDDYQLMHDVLSEAADVIDRGYLGKEDDYVLVTPELSEYLSGIDTPEVSEIASLVGDGLASCVLSFDHRDDDRSRTIILATDNEVAGEQIYSLQEAVKFASDQGIEIIALYPAMQGRLTTEGEQLKSVVESAGGDFYIADDPAAISGIVNRIQSQDLAESEGKSYVVETDEPQQALGWLVFSSLIALAALAWRRL